MTDTELYAALYDIVEARVQETGKTFTADRACYLDLAECPPGTADALALSYETDSILFLKKAYLALLQRPIDDGALEAIRKQADAPVEAEEDEEGKEDEV